jgi:hypothetical protein
MKRQRIFNPLHVFGNKISVSDVEGLKPEVFDSIELVSAPSDYSADCGHENRSLTDSYHTRLLLTQSSHSWKERRSRGRDTFDISDWWKANCAKLPAVIDVACRSHKLTQLLST